MHKKNVPQDGDVYDPYREILETILEIAGRERQFCRNLSEASR
jgi:hypothetical protein